MSEGYKALFRLGLEEKYKLDPVTEISSIIRKMGYTAHGFIYYYETERKNGSLVDSIYFHTNKPIDPKKIKKIKEDPHILELEHV